MTAHPMAFSRDGKHLVLVSTDGTVVIIDCKSGGTRRRLDLTNHIPVGIAIDNTGQIVFCAQGGGLVSLANVDSEPIFHKMEGASYHQAVFSHDGKYVVAATLGGNLTLLKSETMKPERTFPVKGSPITSITFSSDSRQIVASSRDHNIYLFEVDGKQESRVLQGHLGRVWGSGLGVRCGACQDG